MNKKKLNIILIPAVLAVWVIIIIKIFSYAKTPSKDVFKPLSNIFSQDSISIVDTLKIFANYRDPFTPSSLQLVSKTDVIKPQIKPSQNSSNKNVSWPNISYGGLVKNTKDGKELALVKISDRTIITQKNNIIEGIKILALYSDSVKVQLQKETKTIVKK
jgi:hypothetical protein